MTQSLRTHWIYKTMYRRVFVICAILSFISVSLNTPETLFHWNELTFMLLVIDVATGIMLTMEAIVKIKLKGLIKGDSPYMKQRWCVFDFSVTMFIWISIIVQIFEIWCKSTSCFNAMKHFPFGLCRAPRALIMVRAFRFCLRSKITSSKISAIMMRAGQQIWGVTLFLLFFVLLYGLLGVQMFGDFSYHCVTNDTNPDKVTLRNLAIPDTRCDPSDYDSICPKYFVCKKIKFTLEERGFGAFDNIIISIKTVYEAASQEGWVFLMYKSTDSFVDWKGYFYFITLIFFLAWLVKNVFIAVIIDAFAEIRVQLHNLWGNPSYNPESASSQVLSTVGDSWHLVAIEKEKTRHIVLEAMRRALRSKYFHMSMLFVILLNLSILAFQPTLDHTRLPGEKIWNFFSVSELFFTVVFDLEALLKIICLGPAVYFRRSIYQYEAFLAFITTFNTIYSLKFLRSIPVLRIMRLVKLYPKLESFVYKIFGPIKKIGALVTFTISILTLMASVSLQIFCYVEHTHFGTFPQAFMSMFQILTQEGWIDVMHATMLAVREPARPFVCIYFIMYHLFATTVLVSLFVAVILDNLELGEDLKRLKQLKLSELSVDTKQKLPWRLRVFGRFASRPRMTRFNLKLPELQMPRIRESYMRHFLDRSGMCKMNAASSLNSNIRKRSKDDMFMFTPGHLTESTYIGAAFLTGLGVQLSGGAGGTDDNDDELKKKRSFFVRNLTWKTMPFNNEVNADKLLFEGHIQKIMKAHKNTNKAYTVEDFYQDVVTHLLHNCTNYRQSNSTGEFGRLVEHSSRSNVFAQHQTTYERPSFRQDRVKFQDEPRQQDDMFQSGPLYSQNQGSHDVDFKLIHLKKQEAVLKRERQERELRENHPLFDTPVFLVPRESHFRKICQIIVSAQYGRSSNVKSEEDKKKIHVQHDLIGMVTYLDWVMIFVTVLSCGSMMLETPTRRITDSESNQLLLIAEYIFVVFMSIELLLKLIAGGLFFTPRPIMKDFGGVLDAFIYIVSLLFLCQMPDTIPAQSSAQVLLMLRSLRPLRIFRLVPQIRKVVVEMFQSFKEILMVSILLLALMFVFASFGVQMYGGKLAACNDRTISERENCKGIFYQQVWVSNSLNVEREPPGFMVPRVWTNPRNFNFDSMGEAMLTLFEVMSLKGWIEVRDILIERVGPIHGFYIHIFVFLGSMMGITLFIGVVVANYNENKGCALLTVDQRRWENLKCRLKIAQPLHLPPRPTGANFRAKMYDVSQHPYFKRFITLCIMVQSLLLSLKWVEEESMVDYFAIVLIVFNVIFVIEIIVKMIGMTFFGMLGSWRIRYDLVVSLMGIVWTFIYLLSQNKTMSYNMGTILIILRFLGICGKHAILKMLMTTVAMSVYKSFFIIAAMFLLMLCYAFAGVVLFGTVKYGEMLNRHANFASAPVAIAVLFRIVTGEDWNKIMHDCMIQPPQCTPADNYWETDCGNVTAALVYFCSFYVIISYIMLNLLVAIIMENFSLFYTMDEEILLGYNYLHMFQVTWNMVKRKGSIPVKHLKPLLLLLEGKLQIDPDKDGLLLKHMMYEMLLVARRNAGYTSNSRNIPTKTEDGNLEVSFHDTLLMLAYRSIDIRKSLQLEELIMREKLEVEIEEAVAKQTICDFLMKCVKKNRQKSKTSSMMDSFNPLPRNNRNFSPKKSIITIPKIGQDKDTEQHEFKYTKSGKLRRTGTWKGPQNISGNYSTQLLKPLNDGKNFPECSLEKQDIQDWWGGLVD